MSRKRLTPLAEAKQKVRFHLKIRYPDIINTFDPYVPNLLIPEPRGRYHGLWINIVGEGNKTFTKTGGPTLHNKHSFIRADHMKRLEELGFKCLVCRGFDETRKAIEVYLKR